MTIFDQIEDATRAPGVPRGLGRGASRTDRAGRPLRRPSIRALSCCARRTSWPRARYVAEGDLAQGLAWANRALRLMPENPFLLVMVADIAAKQRDFDLAVTSARDALRYLEHAEPPSHLSRQQWPQVRDGLRATALFVQGRVAARARTVQGSGTVAAGLAHAEPGRRGGAVHDWRRSNGGRAGRRRGARVLACGPDRWRHLPPPARDSLRALHARSPAAAGVSFDAWLAGLKWNPPEPAAPVSRPREPGRYAGSQACRECHARAYTNWQSTGMAQMFRELSPRRRHRRLLGQADRLRSRARGDGWRRATSSRSAAATTTPGFAIRSTTSSGRSGSRPTRRGSRIRACSSSPSNTAGCERPGSIIGRWWMHRGRRAPTSRSSTGAGRCGVSDHMRAVPHEPVVVRKRRHRTRGGDVSRRRHQLRDVPRSVARSRRAAEERRQNRIDCDGDPDELSTPAGRAIRGCVRAVPRAIGGARRADGRRGESLRNRRALPHVLVTSSLRRSHARRSIATAATARRRSSARRSRARSVFAKAARRAGRATIPHPSNAAQNPNSLKFAEDADAMCVQCHTAFGDAARTAHAPRGRHRGEPVRLVPHAAHHGGGAVSGTVARDRRHSRCGDDGALRQRRQPECVRRAATRSATRPGCAAAWRPSNPRSNPNRANARGVESTA